MSAEDKRILPEGYYTGTIEDYGISKTTKDQAQAFIKFKIRKGEGEGFAMLTWYGSLSEKVPQGKENAPAFYTVKTLLDCGFKGDEVEDLAQGITSGVIEKGKEMQLTVQDNLFNDKLTSRIAWVNIIGSGGAKSLSKEELVGKTNTSALRALLLKEKANRPADEPIDVGF